MSNIKWSKQKIIDMIRELHETGEDLSDSFMKKHHNALKVAACDNKYFGSWRNAVTEAGLDYNEIIKLEFWSKEKIINKILELYEKGEDLNSSYVQKHYVALHSAACKEGYFSSWKKAIIAAGLDYDKINKYSGRTQWTKEKIIDMIRELHEAGEDLSAAYNRDYRSALYNATCNDRYLGSWRNAITATGLDYNEIIKVEFWSKQKIVERILELHEAGEDLSDSFMKKHHSALIYAACNDRYFGSWENAITAAGLDYNEIIKVEFWSKQKIIDTIVELHQNGESLNSHHMKSNHSTLYWAACKAKYFGSWENAITTTGLDYDEISKVEFWSKQKIIENIRELYEAGEDLNARYTYMYHGVLYAAACSAKYFGSWENAITAAGLDYEKIRKDADLEQWDKQKIIDRIRELHEAGEDLSAHFMIKHYNALFVAACSAKYFGSWENAITAAGLDYEKIRRDPKTESYKGFLLEKYLKEIFKAIGKGVYVQKSIKFEEGVCRPDFVDKDSGLWMDCKLRSWSFGIENTAQKYLKYVDTLIVYYLIGEPRRWYEDKVVFKCVKDFYPQLKELGRDDIVQELSLLERGVIPSKYQKDLDDF